MSNSMLNGIALAAAVGPITTLMKNMSGDDGEQWLTAFNRFLRKENPWPEVKQAEPAPVRIPQFKLSEIYTVHVTTYALPDMLALEADFGQGNVSTIFDGQDWRKWEQEPSCAGDEITGDREMQLGELTENMTREQILAAVPDGWRVALPADGVAFAKKHPELQRQFWILILGASALRGGGRRDVPVLVSDSRYRYLNCLWRESTWRAGDRVLLVRKFKKS